MRNAHTHTLAKKKDDSDNSLDFAPPSSSNGPLEINVDDAKFNSLSSIGGWMNYIEENLLLIRIGENDFRAFDNACPHQGARNLWSFDGSNFTCSNHNNSFSASCSGSLRCYETNLEGNILTIEF